MSSDPSALKSQLTAFLRAETGGNVELQDLQALPGGASRDTWLVAGLLNDEPFVYVLRRDLETSMIDHALSRREEFIILQAAYENGVKVPRPRHLAADTAPLGRAAFLMDFVEGVSIGPKVVRDPDLAAARRVLPQELAEQLAAIHSIPLNERLAFLRRPPAGSNPARFAIEDLRRILKTLNIHSPTLEFGLRWAEEHAPTPARQSVVHGDYRVGNFLVGTEGLAAIIDWEFCHVGDPAEDLAWLCVRDWRFGNGSQHLAGIAEREPFIVAYEKARQVSIDRRAVDYWEILGNLRWAVTCLSQANRHLSGGDVSVEFASLGRRSAEMQLEMLRLIQNWDMGGKA